MNEIVDDIRSESMFISEDGQELYEHFRFVAEKGQTLLRVDKFLVSKIEGIS